MLALIFSEVEKPKGEVVIRTIAMPADTNPTGDIFGGWVMSQMDLGSALSLLALSHVSNLAGEISAIKGTQGLKGYPF